MYTVSIPTLSPRPADDYDWLCYRLYFSNYVSRPTVEKEVRDWAKALGEKPGPALDNAWTHARLMASCMRKNAQP